MTTPVATTSAGPGPGSASWRRWLRTGYVVALVAAAALVLATQREAVADLLTGTRPLPLVGALALGMVSLCQSAWFWRRSLTTLDADTPFTRVLEATVAAIPGRYLPGGIWYSAGRVARLRQRGTRAVPLAVTASLEMFLSFMVAVSLGLALVALSGNEETGVRLATLVCTAVALAAFASPWVVNPLVRWVARRRGIAAVPRLAWSAYLELCGHLVTFWTLSSTAFVLYLSAFPAIDTDGVIRTAGTYLLGWAAGFIAVFAPQGAGVFETAVASTLDGAPLAALAVLVGGYRAVTALRDVIALTSLALWRAVRDR